MAALEAPAGVWLLSLLVVLYVIKAGRGGVILGSSWVSILISIVVALDIFPVFWPDQIHYKFWASTILFVWFTGLYVTYLLSCQKQILSHVRFFSSRVDRALGLAITVVCLQTGKALFDGILIP